MRALVLDGTAADDAVGRQIAVELPLWLAATGYASTCHTLRERRIQFCMGEFDCWVKTPGVCRFADDGRTIAADLVASELVVLLTPITFGGYSAELKKALDRIICVISPSFTTIAGETHHKPRYARAPALLAIGLLAAPEAESERIFTTLVGRNAINLHAPAHAALPFVRHADLTDLRRGCEQFLQPEVQA